MSAPVPPPPPPVVATAEKQEKLKHVKPPSAKLMQTVQEIADAAPVGRLPSTVVDLHVPPSAALYRKKLKIFFVSDTHNGHSEIKVPENIDIFIHSGDFTQKGDWRAELNDEFTSEIPSSVARFNQWLGTITAQHKIVIAGNHEIGFNNLQRKEIRKILTNATYLQDQELVIHGIKFYGSPWTTSKHMGFSANHDVIAKKWAKIPKDVDVLITHMPPRDVKDMAYSSTGYRPWGSESLLAKVKEIKPKIHFFGHVHDDVGMEEKFHVVFINGAYELSHKAYLVHVPAKKK